MSTPDLTNVDIDAILADVQNTLVTIAKSEKARAEKLAKAVGEEQSKMDADDANEAAPPMADDKEDAEASAPEAEGSAPPADDPAAPGDEGGEAGDKSNGSMDPAALQSEYAKLPLDELKMHMEAAQAALAAAMGGGMAAGAPAAGPAGPGAGVGPEASAPPAMKGEMKEMMKVDGNGGKVAKSEAEVASLRKSLEEQGKMLERVIGAFEAVVSKPMRKAETTLTPAAAASAPKLSKSEIAVKLRSKVRDQSLTKNDRELINDFFLNANVDVSKLSHLLK
jgi:hypothetical protein